MNITKWAFGTAPLKKETHLKNIGAIENVSKFLDNLDVPTDGLLMSISWVKGLDDNCSLHELSMSHGMPSHCRCALQFEEQYQKG